LQALCHPHNVQRAAELKTAKAAAYDQAITGGILTDVRTAGRTPREELVAKAAHQAGLTLDEYEQWQARGLFPSASRQWHAASDYDGLPAPNPPPTWWPPADFNGIPTVENIEPW
jgi:hypothetical protein